MKSGQGILKGAGCMKIFTNEFEELLVEIIGYGLLIGFVVLVIGLVGGIEQGLIWRL